MFRNWAERFTFAFLLPALLFLPADLYIWAYDRPGSTLRSFDFALAVAQAAFLAGMILGPFATVFAGIILGIATFRGGIRHRSIQLLWFLLAVCILTVVHTTAKHHLG